MEQEERKIWQRKFKNRKQNSAIQPPPLVGINDFQLNSQSPAHTVCQRVLIWFIEDQAFLLWLLPHPSLPSVSLTGYAKEGWERETTCWWERVGRSQIVRRQESHSIISAVRMLKSALMFYSWLGPYIQMFSTSCEQPLALRSRNTSGGRGKSFYMFVNISINTDLFCSCLCPKIHKLLLR